MNDEAVKTFEKRGGKRMVGANAADGQPERDQSRLQELHETRKTNVHTIEKNGLKRLIYQAPWFGEGEHRGFVELSMEIPFNVPQFNRG